MSRNASRSYINAGYKSKNPDVDAHKLLVSPSIQEAIQPKQKVMEVEIMDRFEVTQDRIIQELASIAFFDLKNVMKEDCTGVAMKTWGELDPKVSRALSSVQESSTQLGGSASVRAHDKTKALELLGKHIGMWRDKDAGHQSDLEARKASLQRLHELIRKRNERAGQEGASES